MTLPWIYYLTRVKQSPLCNNLPSLGQPPNEGKLGVHQEAVLGPKTIHYLSACISFG